MSTSNYEPPDTVERIATTTSGILRPSPIGGCVDPWPPWLAQFHCLKSLNNDARASA